MYDRPKVIHAVTVAESIPLMRGQLGYLKETGYEVHLVSSEGAELDHICSEEGVEGHRISMVREIAPLKDLKSLIQLIRLYQRIKPDLSNVGTPKAGLLAGLAAFITRVPIRIYSLRGLRLETTKGLKKVLLYWIERITCMLAHQVFCDSRSLRDKAVQLKLVKSEKTIVLGEGSSNGVDLRRYVYTEEMLRSIREIRNNFHLAEGDKVIGFVGRLSIEKGIVELIEAYKKIKSTIPEVKLLLVGRYRNGDPIPHETFEYLGADPNVILAGHVKDPEPYYFCMNVLAFPTYREGFGNVSIEAAAAGIPVVTTDATGSIDTVIPGETGYIVPVRNIDLLANALLDLLKNEERASVFGQAGKKRVEEHFSSEGIWLEIHRIYSSHMNEKKKKKGLTQAL